MSALGFMGWQGPDWQGFPDRPGIWVFRGSAGKGAINIEVYNKGKPHIPSACNEEGRSMKLTDLLFRGAQWCFIRTKPFPNWAVCRLISHPTDEELVEDYALTREIRHVLESEMPDPNTFY